MQKFWDAVLGITKVALMLTIVTASGSDELSADYRKCVVVCAMAALIWCVFIDARRD